MLIVNGYSLTNIQLALAGDIIKMIFLLQNS